MTMGKMLVLAGVGVAAAGVAVQRSGAQDAGRAGPGTWTLARVEGRALPTVVDTDGPCRDELVRGTLTLGDGTWTMETVERELCDGRPPREDRETEHGRYTVSGQTLAFTDDDGDDDDAPSSPDGGVDVDEPASGTVDGGTLTVRLREGQTVVFHR